MEMMAQMTKITPKLKQDLIIVQQICRKLSEINKKRNKAIDKYRNLKRIVKSLNTLESNVGLILCV